MMEVIPFRLRVLGAWWEGRKRLREVKYSTPLRCLLVKREFPPRSTDLPGGP